MKQIKILLLSCFLNLLLTYKLSCASDISDGNFVFCFLFFCFLFFVFCVFQCDRCLTFLFFAASDVCTIEGLFSLTGTASSAISPTFSLAQEVI